MIQIKLTFGRNLSTVLPPRPTSTPKNIQLFIAYFIGDLDQVPIFHSEFWPITL